MEEIESNTLVNEVTSELSLEDALALLRTAGSELPIATQLINLQTNNVFAEPGP